jgi:hypothetical protein
MGKVKITDGAVNNWREPIVEGGFGFAGFSMSEIYQTLCYLESDAGEGLGLGTQNPLWCDGAHFRRAREPLANTHMIAVTGRAIEMVKGQSFERPDRDLINEDFFRELHKYNVRITGIRRLKETSTRNALVPLEYALLDLHMQENDIENSDELVPKEFQPALSQRKERAYKVAATPLVSYTVSVGEIRRLLREGRFFMKVMKF